MIFNIPPVAGRSSELTVRSDGWEEKVMLDDSMKTYEVAIPDEIDFENVEAFVFYYFPSGKIDSANPAAVLKTRKRRKLPPRN